jgi:Na+/phosphate symporter
MTNREYVINIEIKAMMLKAEILYRAKLSKEKSEELNEVLNSIDCHIDRAITILNSDEKTAK